MYLFNCDIISQFIPTVKSSSYLMQGNLTIYYNILFKKINPTSSPVSEGIIFPQCQGLTAIQIAVGIVALSTQQNRPLS